MTFRMFIDRLEKEGKLIHVKKECDVNLEVANVLNALDEKPVIFEKVKNYDQKIVGGICGTRELIAMALGTNVEGIIQKIINAMENPVNPNIIENAPCQEVIMEDPDISKLPILKYLEKDGGRYIPSGIVIVKDPINGRNACYHRLMEIDKNKFVARIIKQRGTDKALENSKSEIEFAVCIGNSIPVLMAAATSLPVDKDEMAMANALEKTDLVKCKTVNLEVPAECEYVIEGKITNELATEGPFLDLTETYDGERQQQIFKVTAITHRKDPIMQVLLPGKSEHKMLMGMPKEPTIYNEVNKVVKCKNVNITPGGCSWLHAVVQIEKQNPDDGMKALEAAFKGHGSLKRCIVVDDDINLFDSNDVEWALATRFQANKDSVLKSDQPGSSLDPSGKHEKGKKTLTCKQGMDATIPSEKNIVEFKRVEYPKVDIKNYLE